MMNLETTTTKTIEEIRKNGIDEKTMERVVADRAEIERRQQEAKERLPGKFISFREDKETKTLLFSGEYQSFTQPAKDFVTKQVIPNKTVKRWRWHVFDVTNGDNPEPCIWERGAKESEQILYWISQNKLELVVMRVGRPNSTDTSYNIWPATK